MMGLARMETSATHVTGLRKQTIKCNLQILGQHEQLLTVF